MTRVELQGEVADASPDLVILTADDIHWSEGVVREARCLGWDGLALYMDEPEEGHWRGWLNLPEGLVAICRTAPPAEFARKFAARFNRPADRAAWYGYRAASTVVEAVDRSRSKDRNEIRRVCAHLPTFDRTGDTLSNGLDVSVVQGGSLRVTETFTPAPRPPDKPKPRLTISFHGTLDSHVDAAYKGMVHLDMKGTFYIDPARLDTEEGAAAVDVERLRSWGHEIVAGAPGGGTVSPGKTLDEARSVVDRALADGKHIELLFEGDLDKYEFRELCEYINSKGVLVVPARERTR